MNDIYRIIWEERNKLLCPCCTDESHPWYERENDIIVHNDLDMALMRAENDVWDLAEGGVEIRNVHVQRASLSKWENV